MHASHIDQSGVRPLSRVRLFVRMRLNAMLASAMLCVCTYTARLLYDLCCNFRTADGVLGVCGAMALCWNGQCLFNLAPSDINYAIYGQDKDMGISSHGAPGLNAEDAASDDV